MPAFRDVVASLVFDFKEEFAGGKIPFTETDPCAFDQMNEDTGAVGEGVQVRRNMISWIKSVWVVNEHCGKLLDAKLNQTIVALSCTMSMPNGPGYFTRPVVHTGRLNRPSVRA
jgi:hypothetical protein